MGGTKTLPPSMKPRVTKKPTKGKRQPFQDKHIIENVRSFFEKEIEKIKHHDNVCSGKNS